MKHSAWYPAVGTEVLRYEIIYYLYIIENIGI